MLAPCCSEAEQASLAGLLVGAGVSKVFADRNGICILDGVVERVKSRPPVFESGKLVVDASIEYEAVYPSAPGGAATVGGRDVFRSTRARRGRHR